MSDTHVEVSREAPGSAVRGSCGGFVLGLMALVGAVVLLAWNERRSVTRDRILDAGSRVVVTAPADRIDPALEGKLVHVSGKATTTGVLHDRELRVAEGVLRLRRTVEMYQWGESQGETTRHREADGTTVRRTTWHYSKGWNSRLVASSSFKQPKGHENPAAMPLPSIHAEAENAFLGPHRLTRSLLAEIDTWERVETPNMSGLPAGIRERARWVDGKVFIGKDPGDPEVGDARAWVEVVRPLVVSVVSCQSGGTLAPYRPDGGEGLELLEVGTLDAPEMFRRARQRNVWLTWGLRLGGGLLMWMGFGLVLQPVAMLASWVPLLGELVAIGVGLVALVLASLATTAVVASAWLWNRPWLAAGGAAAAILAVVVLLAMRRRSRTRPALA